MEYKGKPYISVLYWKNISVVCGPHKVKGTAYYKDPDCKQFFCVDYFKAKRKTGVETINGVSILAIKI